MIAAILALISKILDVAGQVLGFIFPRMNEKKKKKDNAQKQMDKAVADDDPEAFLDGRARKHGA